MIRRSFFILMALLPLVAGAEPAEKGVEELASLGATANGAVKPSLTPLASELLGEGGAPALPSLDQSADQSLADFALPLPADLPESDIPLAMNDKVARFVQHFQTNGREVFSRWLSRSERYIPSMREVLRQRGLPEDLVYLAMIESGFAPDAYSCARAAGPWQFMPQTAKGFSLRIDPWIDERRDPVKSTVAAAMYLKELYVLFDQDWYLAAAGYNAGENKVLRAIRRYKSRDFWKLAERSYLKRETRDYVPKLLAAAIIAKEPAKYGFADVAYLTPIEFDTVTIPEQTDLEVVARLCNVSEETIRELNPEILLWCTPPNSDNYELKIPKGSRQAFLDAYGQLSPGERYSERLIFSRYRVKRGESLKSLARKFGTTT
ncbi:MAG TPA: transglycosylase SLT domain-containing protein, partial [Geobacterales bacterium]|nr:transglycosylase SLT domain-containing protein [Geobacterales bacterium]